MTPVLTPAAGITTPPPAAPPLGRRRSVVIGNVDWDTYEKVMDAFGDRRRVRFAYDTGVLEIMSPISYEHEGDKEVLGDLVKALARAFRLPARAGGSVTMARKDLEKGIEPDNCYWLANAPKLARVKRLNLTIHPPPDLAFEVDVTNDSLDKLAIYSAIGVPEVWRLDGDDLRFYRLGPGGTYAEVPTSPAFPAVTPADLMPFVIDARNADDPGDVVDAFRTWARSRAAGGA